MRYQNPILPGFYPDPSVCRVGEDYYLVTSSFEYFPGIPIFHSRDLVHWRQLGHCLTRASQLPLRGAGASQGMYAATLRHHDGRFYLVARNNTAQQMLIVSAADPAGEWSEPLWIGPWGGDPSLFFDDDGQVYLTVCGEGAIHQTTLDVRTGAHGGAMRELWKGTGGAWVEAPHLYRIDGRYYLMLAEGGTEYGHMETIARGPSPWGPFESCPSNPILTHRSTGNPIQATGHADLVQDHRGHWWLVCLGIRPVGRCHHLGRETFLTPVTWENGWPRVGRNGQIDTEAEADGLPSHPWISEPSRDDFDSATLRPCWNFLRNPYPKDWSLTDRPGWLRLTGSAVTLDDADSPAFVGRRQQHFEFASETVLDFQAQPGCTGREEAGLTVRINERHHGEIAVVLARKKRYVTTRVRLGSLVTAHRSAAIPDGLVTLTISGDRDCYRLGYALAGSPSVEAARFDCRFLSSEVAGGHTGVYLGMYATGNGRPGRTPAYFDRFDYRSKETQ
jgi:alpha-N-arabinofuranosidase